MEVDASGDLVFGTNLNGIYSGSGSLSGGTIITQASNNLTLSTTGDANTLQVDATNGRIGVNQSTPLSPLHVEGATRLNGSLLFDNEVSIGRDEGGTPTTVLTTTASDTRLYTSAGRTLDVYGSGGGAVPQMTIRRSANDGLVGIGWNFNTNPAALLQLKQADQNLPVFKAGTIASPDNFVVLGNQSGAALTAGFVGVNTATPLERFHVNGNIRADGNYIVNGNTGFTGTGAYTNFTIEGGIITAAS